MAAAVSTKSSFVLKGVSKLFRSDHFRMTNAPGYDVSLDRQRFVMPEPLEPTEPAKIWVVLNWFEEFRAGE